MRTQKSMESTHVLLAVYPTFTGEHEKKPKKKQKSPQVVQRPTSVQEKPLSINLSLYNIIKQLRFLVVRHRRFLQKSPCVF